MSPESMETSQIQSPPNLFFDYFAEWNARSKTNRMLEAKPREEKYSRLIYQWLLLKDRLLYRGDYNIIVLPQFNNLTKDLG